MGEPPNPTTRGILKILAVGIKHSVVCLKSKHSKHMNIHDPQQHTASLGTSATARALLGWMPEEATEGQPF